MSDQSNGAVLYESPASWNTRYVTEDGFTCQLTLRAVNGKELIVKGATALGYLKEQGCIPYMGYSKGSSNGNNNGGNSKSNNGSTWCPIHDIEMKRWEKEGRVWHSHKTAEGAWCKGK